MSSHVTTNDKVIAAHYARAAQARADAEFAASIDAGFDAANGLVSRLVVGARKHCATIMAGGAIGFLLVGVLTICHII